MKVVTQLGNQAFKLTKDRFVKLLSMEDLNVIKAISPNIEYILKHYWSEESVRSGNQMDDILRAIVIKERQLASSKQLDWRAHHDILKSFDYFCDYFDSDLVFDICIPVLFKILDEVIIHIIIIIWSEGLTNVDKPIELPCSYKTIVNQNTCIKLKENQKVRTKRSNLKTTNR